MAIARIDSPQRLTIAYVVIGMLWILLSDGLLVWVSGETGWEWLANSSKGMLFIGCTAGMLFILTSRLVERHRETAAELRTSQQRLSLALEAANQGLYDLDLVTGEAVVNETYARMLGYDPETFRETNLSWRERLHPEDRERVYQTYKDYISGRLEVYRVEFRLRTADGGWLWMLSLGRVVERDKDGRPLRMLGTHTDITERKSAESRISDALAFAKTVIYSSPVGIIAYGPDGLCVSANESAARIAGCSVADLLRQNFRRLESWKQSGMLESAERALQTGAAQLFRGALHTTFGRNPWVEAHLVPFGFRGDQHLLLLLDDMTDEHKAQENLHLLQAALKAAPSGWVITNEAGVVEWVNPAFTRMTGYAAEEVVGQNPRLLRSGRHPPEFYRRFWETIQRGEVWQGEMCNRRKDGTFYDEHMTVAPVRDTDGAIRHFVAIKHDITEHKQLEQQFTRTQRLESIGMLASGIAHDLNNVLTPILLSIELLKAKFPHAGGLQYIETVESAAQRGAGIVRQVLTFARGIDGGERTELQPRYLLKDVVRLIEETFPRNIEIRQEASRSVRSVVGDLTQLHQVMLNLAVNARDAMPEGGVLTLGAQDLHLAGGDAGKMRLAPGDYVAFRVSDTGTGITTEVMEHMFDPFYTTKPRGKGTGLGLSTVYGIVRSHGGGIDVRTQLGQGTTFEILLPAAPVQAVSREKPVPSRLPSGAGRLVLVVDDEAGIRTITARVLTQHGFAVVLAADGCEGWNEFQVRPEAFAAAVVDMMMPRMGGPELAAKIHAVAPGLPIVFVTGLMEAGSHTKPDINLPAIGVRKVLHKPYPESELLKVLGEVLPPVTVST